MNRACAQSRIHRENKCYNGGNLDHRKQIADVMKAIKNCEKTLNDIRF